MKQRFTLDGKSVLVTGGTGSFGQALRQAAARRATSRARLIVFSRDELKQYEMQQEFRAARRCASSSATCATASGSTWRMRGVDYRHPRRGAEAGAGGRIQSVRMHQDQHPRRRERDQRRARRSEVKQVVALSTDKAANPINLYGATKLASDKIFVAANNLAGGRGTRFSVVRYGNVVGSRGWWCRSSSKLIARRRDDLPITDPRMTRFWITLRRRASTSCSPCLELMHGGEIFVPKIPSHAASSTWPRRWRRSCRTEIVGIRPGEKLHEMMIPAGRRRNSRSSSTTTTSSSPSDPLHRACATTPATRSASAASRCADRLRVQLGRQPAVPRASAQIRR